LSTTPTVDFRGLSIVVAHPQDHDGDLLVRHLQRLGSRVDWHWPPRDRLDPEPAVLFCLVVAAAQSLLHVSTAVAGPAVVAIVNPHNAASLRILDEATPHAVVVAPVEPAAVTAALVVALNNARFQRRQLNKIAKLEETLRSHRRIEQAKAILMERRNIGEPEAYIYLRDQAMRRRIPIGAVAAVVVESKEMLSEDIK